jgi:hypothetical protein
VPYSVECELRGDPDAIIRCFFMLMAFFSDMSEGFLDSLSCVDFLIQKIIQG